MNKVSVVWLSFKEGTPARGYWDQVLLERLFVEFNHTENIQGLEGAIVVIPGAYQGEFIKEINETLNKLKWCLVFITSDEENKFPIDELKHDNMTIFASYPNTKYKNVHRWIPIGPARKLNIPLINKSINWSFSGQITHEGREEYAKVLRERDDGELIETSGFAQGLSYDDYHDLLAKSKVVPAPSGPLSPDSFRLYEAIEAGAVPIPYNPEFWKLLYESPPFPIIEKYEQLNGYIDDAIKKYPKLSNDVQVWWIQEQNRIKQDIYWQLEVLGNCRPEPWITVMIPVSPIKSHPNVDILYETIQTIRHHLPKSKIILTFDGIRKEDKKRTKDYNEFIRRILWLCNTEWENVLPLLFKEHTHQVGMAKIALEYVDTPLILYCEQDTPLTPDMEISWNTIGLDLLTGQSNMVRFHFESSIPKEHSHMIHGMDAHTNSPLMMTSQWSQRPHLATTAFYRRILDSHFSDKAKSFIEDKMHGVVHEAYLKDGMLGWEQFRIHIYAPEGNIKRSYHTDGRDGEAKYDDTQVF